MGIMAVNAVLNHASEFQLSPAQCCRVSERGAEASHPTGNIQSNQKEVETGKGAGFDQLTEEEKKEVQELKKRDAEVKAHERAHVAAGGQYVKGGAHYEYQRGPDGRIYVVGGEVSIDTSGVPGDPQATIQKMKTVKRAALAPADPSAKDRAVAAEAAQKETKARMQLAQIRREGGTRSEANESIKQVSSTYGRDFQMRQNAPGKVLDLLV